MIMLADKQVRMFISRMPYPGETSRNVNYLLSAMRKARKDPRLSASMKFVSEHPINKVRNLQLHTAKDAGYDLFHFIDNDVSPMPDTPSFFETAVNFLLTQPEPSVIAAPYCTNYPAQRVCAFKEVLHGEGVRGIAAYGRDKVQELTGIQRVEAIATGMFMMDLRCLDKIKPPYTYNLWEDERETKCIATEDVNFTCDMSQSGVPIYCAWDCWQFHLKKFCFAATGAQ